MALETGDQLAILYNRVARALSERWVGRPKKAIELTDGLGEVLRKVFNLNSFPG